MFESLPFYVDEKNSVYFLNFQSAWKRDFEQCSQALYFSKVVTAQGQSANKNWTSDLDYHT